MTKMTTGAREHRGGGRSRLDFLTRSLAALALIAASCGGGQLTSPDGAADVPPNCANAGCAAPPLCGTGCQAACGCCSCTPGERSGDLICTAEGCFAPVQSICSLPFAVGPCDAAIQVYAYVDGACVQRTYGGCQGNENRFSTQEECMAACEGRPVPNGCPAGRVAQEICLACGPAGGCARSATVCALRCSIDGGAADAATDGGAGPSTGGCAPPLPVCYAGVCQNAFCE